MDGGTSCPFGDSRAPRPPNLAPPVRCLHVRLQRFRAYEAGDFHFAPGLNLLHGPNGAGKTNVLEAVHYLALTKSFVATNDAYAVRAGHASAEIRGDFEGERRGAFNVRVVLGEGGKQVQVGGAPLTRVAEHVGRIPLVVMAPQDYVLTSGGPEERRRFLNNLLSQARPVYLDDLIRYNRALKQRNELLGSTRGRRFTLAPDLLESWTEEVATLGARIVHARAGALAGFQRYLDDAYAHLGDAVERPSLRYDGPVETSEGDAIDAIAERLRARFAKAAAKERENGRTLVGPHRDEVTFRLGAFDVRRYASQGQHRTFGVALRLAQFFYLRDLAGETPVLLLDDLFGSLDPARTRLLLELLTRGDVGQSIVTHPDLAPVEALVPFDDVLHRAIAVEAAGSGLPEA